MLPGETLLSGADSQCPECKRFPKLEVCNSFAGYYVGSWCDCGPYSRESEYFKTEEEAQKEVKYFQAAIEGRECPPSSARTTAFNPAGIVLPHGK